MLAVRKKNGFTLIEVLAVLVILTILLGIALPAVERYLKKGTLEYYRGLETDVLAAGRDYLLDYKSLYPREIGNSTVVTISELSENKYISVPEDEEGNPCDGTVTAIKKGTNRYDYHVCLQCGDKFTSEEEECSYVGNNNEARNYDITLNASLPTTVKQCDELTIPEATVTERVGDESNLISTTLKGNPSSIDTTVLSTNTVTWSYRTKKISKTVQVVDTVAPVIESIKLSKTSGTSYSGEITNKDTILQITAKDYACVAESPCRTKYPKLDGSGIKAVYYKEKEESDWHTYSTSKNEITIPLNQTIYGTLQVKVVDNAGKESGVKELAIQMDKTKPSKTTVQYVSGSSSEKWQNKIQVKLSATDNIQVKHYEIYKDGTYYGTTSDTWTPPNNFSSNNVTFRAVDVAGNKGDFSDSQKMHMDTEKPVHTSWSWGDVTRDLAKLYIKATDNASGVKQVRCRTSTQSGSYNNWVWFDASWDSSASSYRCDITTSTFKHYGENYRVHLYLYDDAGNGGYYDVTNVDIPRGFDLVKVAKPGDYVIYRPSSTPYTSPRSLNGYSDQTFTPSSYTGTWQVLYNNSSYGLQIISSQSVGSLSVYGYTGINNIYDTLNNLSRAYMDGTYATAARHVGTNPASPGDPSGWCDFHGATVKCWERTVYYTDLNGMKSATSQNAAGIASANTVYYLISRQKYHKGDDGNYCVADSRDLSGVSASDYCPVYYNAANKRNVEGRITAGVRPVITLSNTTLVTGTGTIGDPYVIVY